MGGSDGLDVLRTTKSLHPSTAVILMTAFGTPDVVAEAQDLGADVLAKPFELAELNRLVLAH